LHHQYVDDKGNCSRLSSIIFFLSRQRKLKHARVTVWSDPRSRGGTVERQGRISRMHEMILILSFCQTRTIHILLLSEPCIYYILITTCFKLSIVMERRGDDLSSGNYRRARHFCPTGCPVPSACLTNTHAMTPDPDASFHHQWRNDSSIGGAAGG
jgi:hypothetical protein